MSNKRIVKQHVSLGKTGRTIRRKFDDNADFSKALEEWERGVNMEEKKLKLKKQILVLEKEIKETTNPRALGQLYATLEKTKNQWRNEK